MSAPATSPVDAHEFGPIWAQPALRLRMLCSQVRRIRVIPNKVKGLLLLAFLFGMLGRAQAQANLDSLWNVWQDEGQPDTVRARALGRYAWSKYLYQQPDSAEYYGQLMYDFAEQHGSKKWMAWALRGQGVTYKIRGANAKALDYWLRSMEMSGEVKDLSGVAGSENNIGILYFEQIGRAHV